MINKVILVGRVGKDPDVRVLDSNSKVATLRLATDETYKNANGEKVTNTEWHTVVFWRGLASVVSDYVKKGSLIYVEGRLRTREWTDQSGNKRYTTEIQADNMQMLDRRAEQNAAPSAPRPAAQNSYERPVAPSPADSSSADSAPADDLPF